MRPRVWWAGRACREGHLFPPSFSSDATHVCAGSQNIPAILVIRRLNDLNQKQLKIITK